MIEHEFRSEAADTLGAAGAAPGPTPRAARTAPATRRINLALQGGGTHGAFTWGVLERLLEEERIEFEAVSGTSAGAMNAAIFVQGLCQGGRDGARQALDSFWRNAAGRMANRPLVTTPTMLLILPSSSGAKPIIRLCTSRMTLPLSVTTPSR